MKAPPIPLLGLTTPIMSLLVSPLFVHSEESLRLTALTGVILGLLFDWAYARFGPR